MCKDVRNGMCNYLKQEVLTRIAAMKPKEVSDRLQLDNVAKSHTWKVEPSCATTGDGIFEGLVRLRRPKTIRSKQLMTFSGMAFEPHQDHDEMSKELKGLWSIAV